MATPLPPDSSSASHGGPSSRRPTLRSSQVLLAGGVGLVLGGLVGVFLEAIVANTPNTIDPEELHWLRRLLGAAGGLGGLALESIRQLQQSCTDPAYRQRRRLRG